MLDGWRRGGSRAAELVASEAGVGIVRGANWVGFWRAHVLEHLAWQGAGRRGDADVGTNEAGGGLGAGVGDGHDAGQFLCLPLLLALLILCQGIIAVGQVGCRFPRGIEGRPHLPLDKVLPFVEAGLAARGEDGFHGPLEMVVHYDGSGV